MKRILVPTDFSEYAEYALRVAAQIAKENNSEIILLHMLELPNQAGDAIGSGHDIPEIMFFKNKAISKLEELMDSDFLEGIPVSEIIQFDKAFEGILAISKINNVDFIVMGSHGSNGFQEMLIGSNTEKVVRFSDVPVLTIKNSTADFKAINFVFASDFSEEIKKPFKKLIEFAKAFNSDLSLVMINTPGNFKPTLVAEKIMSDFIKEFDYNNYSLHIYNDVNIEKGVLNFANSVNADIIGMCTHGRRNGLAHFFNGSVSEDLVNHASRPVITFKI
ncbi:universal stress protein [Flavobacterium psychrotolerans]|uniref:Universal stress protein UspA n=1 Tax=Flavobacterium psychrotolerans TaxID=2169410 RepID=A0A2U1JL00_9FLAO|nr:universal stress protein [Flavobacterium psychrotolerans]PWA05659.1 universal stress protein UspA [Flavobacterium psychrotolerans]